MGRSRNSLAARTKTSATVTLQGLRRVADGSSSCDATLSRGGFEMRLLTSRSRACATNYVLLGTTSLLVLASAEKAYAAAPPPAAPAPVAAAPAGPVEEILITGSLIAGAAAVGVPVTTIGDEVWDEVGAISTVDLLKTIPTLEVQVFAAGTLFGS